MKKSFSYIQSSRKERFLTLRTKVSATLNHNDFCHHIGAIRTEQPFRSKNVELVLIAATPSTNSKIAGALRAKATLPMRNPHY